MFLAALFVFFSSVCSILYFHSKHIPLVSQRRFFVLVQLQNHVNWLLLVQLSPKPLLLSTLLILLLAFLLLAFRNPWRGINRRCYHRYGQYPHFVSTTYCSTLYMVGKKLPSLCFFITCWFTFSSNSCSFLLVHFHLPQTQVKISLGKNTYLTDFPLILFSSYHGRRYHFPTNGRDLHRSTDNLLIFKRCQDYQLT